MQVRKQTTNYLTFLCTIWISLNDTLGPAVHMVDNRMPDIIVKEEFPRDENYFGIGLASSIQKIFKNEFTMVPKVRLTLEDIS